MLLRKPAFAVLDEATSAIDADVEAELFEKLTRRRVSPDWPELRDLAQCFL